MISYTKKFIFIHIPRTGGTSIEKSLELYAEGKVNTKIGKGGIYNLPPELEKRVNKILGNQISRNAKHMTALDWKQVLGEEYNDYYKFTIIRHPLTKAFSMLKFNERKTEDNEDWVNFQCMYFEDENGEIIVDDIFKYEELEESWKKICNNLKIEYKPLPHENKLKKNEEMKNIEHLKLFFQEEIVKLGYE